MQEKRIEESNAVRIPLTDAARMLDIAYYTAWQWSKAGKFEGLTRTGAGRIYVPLASVEAIKAARAKGVRHDG